MESDQSGSIKMSNKRSPGLDSQLAYVRSTLVDQIVIRFVGGGGGGGGRYPNTVLMTIITLYDRHVALGEWKQGRVFKPFLSDRSFIGWTH